MAAKFLDLNNLSSQQQSFVLLNDGSEVWATVLLLSAIIRFSISVRVSAKTRLISSNPDLSNRTKPNKKPIEPNRTPIVRLGWAIEQNRTPILL